MVKRAIMTSSHDIVLEIARRCESKVFLNKLNTCKPKQHYGTLKNGNENN